MNNDKNQIDKKIRRQALNRNDLRFLQEWSVSNCDEWMDDDSSKCQEWELGYKTKNGEWSKLDHIDGLATTSTVLIVISIITTVVTNLITGRPLQKIWSIIAQYQTFLAFTLIGILKCKLKQFYWDIADEVMYMTSRYSFTTFLFQFTPWVSLRS